MTGRKKLRAVPLALFRDPSRDQSNFVARTLPLAIPSQGLALNAVLYVAGGPGPHPTVLLLHGLPGNEQNIDCAQTLRRAGWNVLTFHYRGSWGSPGFFTLSNCLEDAVAALNWLRDPVNVSSLRIESERIVIIGHSVGGFVAAHVSACHPEVLGMVMISGVDIRRAFGNVDESHGAAAIDGAAGISAGLRILAGTSPESLAEEVQVGGDRWCLATYASRLLSRPLLAISSDDGFAPGSDAFADAVKRLGGDKLIRAHMSSDHSYSNRRIELQVRLLGWLETVTGGPLRGTLLHG